MTSKDSLGDRMKAYENVFNSKLPIRLPIILRIDGKSFHSLTKKWKLDPAFDIDFRNIMSHTATYLCKNIDGAKLAYTYSDEISIIIRNDMEINTTPWFDNKIEKICSVAASFATAAFNGYRGEYINKLDTYKYPAVFDARVFVLNLDEVNNYFIWRQQDSSRNSVSSLTRTLYSHKDCEYKNSSSMQEMLFNKGINWNNIDTWKKRGFCIIKRKKIITNPITAHKSDLTITRSKWESDYEIPIFSNSNYINENIINEDDN